MLKLYRVLPDETTVVYSQRQADKTVIVHLERPTEHGFDSARCRLAPVRWLEHSGYSRWEICAFETMLLREEEQLLALAEAAASQRSSAALPLLWGRDRAQKSSALFWGKAQSIQNTGQGNRGRTAPAEEHSLGAPCLLEVEQLFEGVLQYLRKIEALFSGSGVQPGGESHSPADRPNGSFVLLGQNLVQRRGGWELLAIFLQADHHAAKQFPGRQEGVLVVDATGGTAEVRKANSDLLPRLAGENSRVKIAFHFFHKIRPFSPDCTLRRDSLFLPTRFF